MVSDRPLSIRVHRGADRTVVHVPSRSAPHRLCAVLQTRTAAVSVTGLSLPVTHRAQHPNRNTAAYWHHQ